MLENLDWKKPALVGGVIVGLGSLIPFINLLNCCFCGWALIGGAVASKMLIDSSPRQIKTGEGAQVGLMAGLVAGGIVFLISAMLTMTGIGNQFTAQVLGIISERIQDPQFQEQMRQILEQSQNPSVGDRLVGVVFNFVIALVYMAFTVLGGLLGVALFEKRRDQPPPQYPPNYPPNYPPQSGPQSGGYGGDQGNWPPPGS